MWCCQLGQLPVLLPVCSWIQGFTEFFFLTLTVWELWKIQNPQGFGKIVLDVRIPSSKVNGRPQISIHAEGPLMVDRTGQEVKSTPSKGAIGCLASGDTEEKMTSTQDFQVRKISSYFDSEMPPRWWAPSLMNMMPFLGSKASKTLPRPEPFAAFRAPTGVLTSWKYGWSSQIGEGFLGGGDTSMSWYFMTFHDNLLFDQFCTFL